MTTAFAQARPPKFAFIRQLKEKTRRTMHNVSNGLERASFVRLQGKGAQGFRQVRTYPSPKK